MGSSATDAESEVLRLRLLQLNLFLRPPPIASLSGAECKDARAARFCEEFLEGNDVLCLQECFAFLTRRRARLVEAARARGFRGIAFSRRAPLVQLRGGLQFRPIDGGLVLLSRFPFVTSQFRLFSAACDDPHAGLLQLRRKRGLARGQGGAAARAGRVHAGCHARQA
jgi:hypothetical protein